MRWGLVMVALSAPAFAHGFGFELGAGMTTPLPDSPSLSLEAAVDGRFTIGNSGSLEVRVHGFMKPRGPEPFGLGTSGLLRYRSVHFGEGPFGFSLAGGAGLFLGLSGEVREPDDIDVIVVTPGLVIELSPTFEFEVTKSTRFFIALNVAANLVPNWRPLENSMLSLFSVGAVAGFAFDFTNNEKVVVLTP